MDRSEETPSTPHRQQRRVREASRSARHREILNNSPRRRRTRASTRDQNARLDGPEVGDGVQQAGSRSPERHFRFINFGELYT